MREAVFVQGMQMASEKRGRRLAPESAQTARKCRRMQRLAWCPRVVRRACVAAATLLCAWGVLSACQRITHRTIHDNLLYSQRIVGPQHFSIDAIGDRTLHLAGEQLVVPLGLRGNVLATRNRLYEVELALGGDAPTRALLDTGADESIVIFAHQPAGAEVWEATRDRVVAGGIALSRRNTLAVLPRVVIAGAELRDIPLVIGETPLSEDEIGYGIVGAAFLRLFAGCTIENAQRLMTLTPRGTELPSMPAESTTLRLERYGVSAWPRVRVFTPALGSMQAVVDTGCGSELAVGASKLIGTPWEEMAHEGGDASWGSATNLTGYSRAKSYVLCEPLMIGTQEYESLRLVIVDDRTLPEWSKLPLLIGLPLLRKHSIVQFDWQQQELRLGPREADR